jgi:integrase
MHYTARAVIAHAGSKSPSELHALDIPQICTFYEKLGARTRYQRHSELKSLLRYLAEEHGGTPGLWRYVPKVHQPRPRNVTATATERERIIGAAPAHLKCWLLLCSDLALRSGTANRIAPIHYDQDKQEISFATKWGAHQTLPVTSELAAIFASVAEKEGDNATSYVTQLRPKHGSEITGIRKEFHALREALGITKRLTPHDFRRTAAVRTLEITRDLRLVQALLGHDHLHSTLHYLDHHNTPVSRATLEAAKLNAIKEATQ